MRQCDNYVLPGKSASHSLLTFLVIENLEVQIIAKIDVVQRNGQEYMIIKDMSLTTDASYFRVQYNHRNVASIITNMIGGVVNSNWRMMKSIIDPFLNRFMSDALKENIFPLLNKYHLQEIVNGYSNSTCENFGK